MTQRALFLALIFLATTPLVAAEDWYVDVFAGYADLDDAQFETELGTIETGYDSSLAFGIALGYQFDTYRLELEASRRASDVDSHALDGTQLDGATGDANDLSFLFNIFYDFNRDGSVQPYVGAGIGFSLLQFEDFGVDAVPNVLDDDDSGFSYQFVAGLAVPINEQWSFRGDVRYLSANDATVTTSEDTGSVNTDIDYDVMSVTVGFRASF